MDIFNKADELGKMLLESDESIRAVKAQYAQDNDPKAQQMIREYNEKRREISVKVQMNELSDEQMEEVREELNIAFNDLLKYDIINEYIEAKKAYEALMQEVVSRVNGTYSEGGCSSSGCSSCSGCK